jgi:hypothetical protein
VRVTVMSQPQGPSLRRPGLFAWVGMPTPPRMTHDPRWRSRRALVVIYCVWYSCITPQPLLKKNIVLEMTFVTFDSDRIAAMSYPRMHLALPERVLVGITE